MSKAKSGKLSKVEKEQIESFKRRNTSEFLFQMYAGAIKTLCFLEYGRDFNEICVSAKQGKREAFFRIISLDKTFLTVDWVREIIVGQQLRNDTRFFNKLGNAVQANLFYQRKDEILKWYTIELTWMIAAPHFTYKQFHQFLSRNTKSQLPSSKTIQQRLRRCGLTRRAIKASFAQHNM